MQKMPPKLFSPKAHSLLSQYDATVETIKFVTEEGPMVKEIRSFLVSVTTMLKRDCQIQDWRQDFLEEEGYIYARLFPGNWDLPKVGPLAFGVYWANPFSDEVEDLCVYLRIPWNWGDCEGLRELVCSRMPDDFTNVYDSDADRSIPIWRYIRFQDYIENSSFNMDALYGDIVGSFRGLLTLQPAIDEYLSGCKTTLELRPARRELGIVAVVDTETAGSGQELIELAVVNAAYDKQSGDVLGILDHYEGLRQPSCVMSKADQRFNGLGFEQVRGRCLDEKRVKSLLMLADFVVAHKADFDKARVTEQFRWAADLDWRDSLTAIDWGTETRDLPTLLKNHNIDSETSHRAGPDARGLLELLSYGERGKTYLSQLLVKADAANLWPNRYILP